MFDNAKRVYYTKNTMKRLRIKYTLTQRIITLMVIFSILFISAFCAIQIRNQLNTITNFNSYRARLSAIIVKNELEKSTGKIEISDSNFEEDIIPLIKNTITSLKRTRVVESIIIFNTSKEIVATSGVSLRDLQLKPSDYRLVDDILEEWAADRWFLTNIDKEKRILELFIPIFSANSLMFIAKAIFSLGNIEEAMRQVYAPILGTIAIVIFANVILGSILSKTIVKPIKDLNIATKEIAEGNLQKKVNIRTRDEIEELGNTFNYMTFALQKMKDRAENANPLTSLPGNNMIHEEITKRIRMNMKFVVVYADLDNFKAYNDNYGIEAGDKAIKLTAEILQEGLKLGSHDDFLGHEGGDDFVLITTPAKVEKITNYIITEFDKRVRPLYRKEDLERGYIVAESRDGTIKKFPIMTLSLVGVSNELRTLKSYGEITNICAEVKKKAKAIESGRSKFILDRRAG